VSTIVLMVWYKPSKSTCGWGLEVFSTMSNIDNLFAFVNKGNNKIYSYLITKMVGFSQPKYMLTNHMF
jgi:hypothetical protein